MSLSGHNRAVQLCADTVARIAVRAAAMPCDSPAQRRRLCETLLVIADEIATLKIEKVVEE